MREREKEGTKEHGNKDREERIGKSDLPGLIQGYTDSCELRQALQDFIRMRERAGSPIAVAGMKGILEKLDELAEDVDERIEILEQSILLGWKSVFPLRGISGELARSSYMSGRCSHIGSGEEGEMRRG